MTTLLILGVVACLPVARAAPPRHGAFGMLAVQGCRVRIPIGSIVERPSASAAIAAPRTGGCVVVLSVHPTSVPLSAFVRGYRRLMAPKARQERTQELQRLHQIVGTRTYGGSIGTWVGARETKVIYWQLQYGTHHATLVILKVDQFAAYPWASFAAPLLASTVTP